MRRNRKENLCLVRNKLDMDTKNISIEREHHVGEKSSDKERAKVN